MNADQSRMPLLEALTRMQAVERVSLHTPGHKRGSGLPAAFARLAWPLAAWDATEIPGLDDLYDPHGPLREAQDLAARAFGSESAHFLVGGATAGNLAAVLAALRPGDLALVARGAHQSVWRALDLARARVVPLWPRVLRRGGAAYLGPLAAGTVAAALRAHGDAAALIVTSPTYHGAVSDVSALAAAAHAAGAAVVVDEAHGAHLPFHPALPPSAVSAGADLVVHSLHKMTAALTQTGLLHMCGGRMDRGRVSAALRTVQTSSPSYLLMASIDAVRAQLATDGERLLTALLAALSAGAERLRACAPGLLAAPAPADVEALRCDPCKWTLDAAALGCAGSELAAKLRERYGIFAELYDERHVLLLWTYGNGVYDVERTVSALAGLHDGRPAAAVRPAGGCGADALTAAADEFAGVFPVIHPFTGRERIARAPLAAAAGRELAEAIVPYPPGIPLALRGEPLPAGMIPRVARLAAAGVRVDGVDAEGCVRYVEERE